MAYQEEMYQQMYRLVPDFGLPFELSLFILFLIITWSLVWKGIALWKSAHRNSLIWFIIILLTNTLGILEILYVYVFSEMGFGEKKKKAQKKQKKA